jgi:M6 family metalloprotease-like protein
MSFPFYDEEFTFTQPDGSLLRVRGWGDQHYAVFETSDGYTVTQNPTTGFYEYAGLTADSNELQPMGVPVGAADPQNLGLDKGMRIRRESALQKAHEAYRLMGLKRRCEVRRERGKAALRAALTSGGPVMAPPRRGTLGRFVGLCLLVQFPDQTATIAQSEVEDFCNLIGYNGYGNNGSVYDYFYKNSGGLFEYTNIVTSYYTAKNPRSYYTNPAIQHGIRARELIKEALQDLVSKGFDFDQLSADDGGYIYAVNVFYAGPRVNNWGKGLWPHSWSLAVPYTVGTGRRAFDYQITDMGSELSLATFCHENGHMVCDYPDLYDYGYESRGIGNYCLMSGSGSNRKNPVHIGAYLKYKSGWAQSVQTVTHNIHAAVKADENDFYIHAKNRTEYFIIENRQKTGRDSALPDAGLAIWHVDELGSNNYEHMEESKHYECSLEQADNRFDLENGSNGGDTGDLFIAGENDRFANNTEPDSKWWDGTSSNLDIHDIGAAGMEMSFRARLAEEEDNQRTFSASSSPMAPIPDNDATGIQDTLHFPDAATAISVTAGVDIAHTYRGDLRVTLASPAGTTVILHERGGGSKDDIKTAFNIASTPGLNEFAREKMQGDWTLHVQDLAAVDHGQLNSWNLEIIGLVGDGGGVDDTVVELEETPGLQIPDNDPAGIECTLNAEGSGRLKDIEVRIDISHTYIQDLIVTLVAPSGKSIPLHHRSGGSADNIITTYTRDSTPELTSLDNEPVNGTWRLQVADVAGRDVGKLNRWALRIVQKP